MIRSICRGDLRLVRGHHTIAVTSLSLLLWCLVGIAGCASYEPMDMSSYDPSYDQKAIASIYRNQAVAMREKANAQATAAAHYESLFGSEADFVAGALLLARYYQQTAQELDRIAEAHESVDRTRQRPKTEP